MYGVNESQHQLTIETAGGLPPFEELLSLAVEACISDEAFEKNLAGVKEDRANISNEVVAMRLGLWGVREYLEVLLNTELHGLSKSVTAESQNTKSKPIASESEFDAEAEEAAYELLESLQSYEKEKPDPLRLPFDQSVQDKIEAFGKTLLEEAFLCLGEDASQQITRFQNAKTAKTKTKTINWLLERVRKISEVNNAALPEDAGEEGDTDEAAPQDQSNSSAQFYHPARLSPKFIGRFPDIRVQPTCLGMSILLASFFEKAGVPYFHAGVASTAGTEVRESQNNIITKILDWSDEWDIQLSAETTDRLADTMQENFSQINHNNGFHAAVIVRVEQDKWIQLDPYFHSNMLIPKAGGSDRLEEAYKAIDELKTTSRGVECMMINPYGLTPYWFTGLLKELKRDSKPISEIEEFLRNLPNDREKLPDTIAAIMQEYFWPYLPDEPKGEGKATRLAIRAYCEALDKDYEEHIKLTLQDVIFQYVFSDVVSPYTNDWTVVDSINKCKNDPNYLRRRAEDLKIAPFFALLRFHSEHGNEVIRGKLDYYPHPVMEVGMPAYRIGAAVLSDFASYCGDDLPTSFWLSYWPSAVSLVEHSEHRDRSEAQRKIASLVAKSLMVSSLQYSSIDSIINSVLEQKGGEDPDRRRVD